MNARGGHAPAVGSIDGRRRLWLAGVVAAAGALLVAGSAVAGAQEHEDGLLPEGDWSDEQMAAAEDLVMRTEEELPAYADPEQLEAQGFTNFGAAAPGGYDHWTNPDFLVDDHILDPAFPESLVYQYTDDGYELVAAMFELSPGDTMDDIPEDIAWYPGWHTHADICADENQHFTGFVDQDGNCAVGSPILIPMVHVWIVDNECGHRFAGIDQSGLICDVHGHPGGGHGGGTSSTTTHQHDTTSSTTHPHDTTSSSTTTTRPAGAPPATPLPGNPNFTG